MALKRADLWSCRQKRWFENYRRMINRERREITAILRFTPVAIVVWEALNNRHRRYNLGPLTAPKIQLMWNIWPVTLGELEKQVQPEAQLEEDNG